MSSTDPRHGLALTSARTGRRGLAQSCPGAHAHLLPRLGLLLPPLLRLLLPQARLLPLLLLPLPLPQLLTPPLLPLALRLLLLPLPLLLLPGLARPLLRPALLLPLLGPAPVGSAVCIPACSCQSSAREQGALQGSLVQTLLKGADAGSIRIFFRYFIYLGTSLGAHPGGTR